MVVLHRLLKRVGHAIEAIYQDQKSRNWNTMEIPTGPTISRKKLILLHEWFGSEALLCPGNPKEGLGICKKLKRAVKEPGIIVLMDPDALCRTVPHQVTSQEESTVSDSEAKELIVKWAEKSNSLTILVFGKTGAGKSSLINTIFNKEVAKEWAKITPGTKKVEYHSGEKKKVRLSHSQFTINNIKITLWDTPGLRDASPDKEIAEEIREKCKGRLDLFLYCSNICQTRITKDDFGAIQELTNALGRDIWQNTVFVLTYANELHPPFGYKKTLDKYLYDRVLEWKEVLRIAMANADVPIKETELVPFVPASYRKLPLPTSHGPDSEEWLEMFWSGCIHQVRFSSLPAILKLKISQPVYTGTRLTAIGDLFQEQMKAEKSSKYNFLISKLGLSGISSEQFIQFLSEAIAASVRNEHIAEPISVWNQAVVAGIGLATLATLVFMLSNKS